jgi:GAF domain-containing protein
MQDQHMQGNSVQLINLVEKAIFAQNLAELADQAFPEMTEITQSQAGFLYLNDVRLLSSQVFPFKIPASESQVLAGFCEKQFQVITNHPSDSPLITPTNWNGGEPIHLYPLRVEHNCFGMVGLTAQQKLTAARKMIWERFFHLFGGMVDRLIERQQSERQLSHLNTYLTVSSMLSQPLGLHDILEAVLYCSMEAVSAETASVLLLDDEKSNFLFYQVEGPAKPLLDAVTFPTDKGIAGSVFQTQTPEMINDVVSDPRFFGKIDTKTGFQTRNMLALPLTAGEEPVGVLEVINKFDGEAFTDEELFLLLSIAEEIAFAIRNAKIFEYVVDSYCLQRQGLATCRGCKRPLGSWTPCIKYRTEMM